MQDLAATAAGRVSFESIFTHAGSLIPVRVTLDWFRIRLPDQPGDRWIVVARTQKQSPRNNAAARWLDAYADPLILITNRPVHMSEDATQVYQDWHQRPGIEHLYRFIQEDGLDVEKIQLHALERFRREFVLILAAAVFVLRLPHVWAPAVVTWIRQLASAVAGTDRDRGGIYLFLYGIRRILSARSLLYRCVKDPPPSSPSHQRGPRSNLTGDLWGNTREENLDKTEGMRYTDRTSVHAHLCTETCELH